MTVGFCKLSDSECLKDINVTRPDIRRFIINITQGHLNSIIDTGKVVHWGPYTYTTTHRNKTANMDNIKHIFIILIFPTKSVFKNIKKHAIHNIHRLAWGLMLVGPPLNCPTCPCTKTALCIHFVAQSISSMQANNNPVKFHIIFFYFQLIKFRFKFIFFFLRFSPNS
jgi:hypothetical protein